MISSLPQQSISLYDDCFSETDSSGAEKRGALILVESVDVIPRGGSEFLCKTAFTDGRDSSVEVAKSNGSDI